MTKQAADNPQRPRKVVQPSVVVLSEDTINADVKARVPMGSPFFNWLTEIRLDDVATSSSEFDRGVAEGMRRLARQIQDIVLSEQLGS